MSKKLLSFIALTTLNLNIAQASEHSHTHYANSPISIMADHIHDKGQIMLSYNYMEMKMDDLYDGDSKITTNDVNGSVMIPTEMTMKMHMFGLMYGLTNNSSLMLMLNYLENDMEMVNAMNDNMMRMDSDGIGDIRLSVTQNMSNQITIGKDSYFNLGISLPTGSIDERADNGVKLPYKMQLGSGTYDPFLKFTNIGNIKAVNYGVQLSGLFRIGHNDDGYARGNQFSLNYWNSLALTSNFSILHKVNYQYNGKYNGVDSEIENVAMTSITRNANNQSGEIIDYSLGINLNLTKNSNLGFEYSLPLYQNLDGPQLGISESFNIGLRHNF